VDQLAGFGKIYFFFPLRKTTAKNFENPSLEIARLFDIPLGELPGIALFTVLPEANAQDNKVVFFRLDKRLFVDSPDGIENVFNALFQVLKQCQASGKSSEQLLDEVRLEIERLQKKFPKDSRWRYFKKISEAAFVTLPQKMLIAMAEGFGKSFADRAIKGN
jgi:hypothetical protein